MRINILKSKIFNKFQSQIHDLTLEQLLETDPNAE